MKPLGDEARSLIEDAAGAYEPTAEDKKRLRSDVGARIAAVSVGVGVAATTTSVTTTTAAKTAVSAAVVAKTGGVALGTKIGAVLVVASAAAVGAWFASSEPKTARDEREHPSTKVVEREPSPPPAGQGQAGARAATDPPAPPEAPSAAATSPPPPTTVRVAPTTSPAPKPVEEVPSAKPAPAAAPAPATESETTYIRRAETAIDTGDGITALRALDDHGKTYPDGILAGRRDVLRVIATCTVGRVPAAREQAEKYLAEHPRSTEAARIRRVCGTP